MLHFKRLIVSVAALCVLCLGLCIAIGVPATGQDVATAKSKVRTLLEERRDVLKARADTCIKTFANNAKLDYADVLAANDDYYDAELVLISDKAERIAMLEKKLANAKESEQWATSMKEGGRGLQATVLLATANRLAVEIAIEREKE